MARTLRLGPQELSVRWTVLDRAIEQVAPSWAARRLQSRVGHALIEASSSTGGGYNGADPARRNLSGWRPPGGDADSQILRDLPEMRERARDLDRNAPVAGTAINTSVAWVVGTGLSLQSQVDHEYLGISDAAASAWQTDTEREFELWAHSIDCDIARKQNFYQQQDLAYRCTITAGDHLVLLARNDRSSVPVKLALQHIEADRLGNPDRKPDTASLVAGVELEPSGAALAYHVASGNPFRRTLLGGMLALTWRRVPAFGAKSGRRNVLHMFERLRPGQTRGVPMLAPVIEPLKQLERYTEAELTAAVVAGLFTVFIKSDAMPTVLPSALTDGGGGGAQGMANANERVNLGNGAVIGLGPKESIESANPGRPNSNFDPFVSAVMRQVGMRLGIPYEVLTKHYISSYSAARAALLDAWRFFRIRRDWMVTEFCRPVYQAWLDEAVANGRIAAAGYFNDPAVRAAWSGSEWIGDGPGAIDPLKEVNAAKERVQLTISTLAQESILLDGQGWQRKARQRGRERRLLQGEGLPDPSDELVQPGLGAPTEYPSDEPEPAPAPVPAP